MKLSHSEVFSFRRYHSPVLQLLDRVLEIDEISFAIVAGGRDTRLGRVELLDPLDGVHYLDKGT